MLMNDHDWKKIDMYAQVYVSMEGLPPPLPSPLPPLSPQKKKNYRGLNEIWT